MNNTTELGIPRDRYGRYMLTPPSGKKPKAYTRVTTIAKTLDDQTALTAWKIRAALKGAADRKDLLLQLQTLDADRDKREIDQIARTCVELGGGTSAATTGTAIHSILEAHDRGQYVLGKRPPAELAETLDTYQALLEACNVTILPELIETCLVNDDLGYAGTVDRIVTVDGVHYIADIKTGKSLEYGALGFGMQLAAYAHCTHATTDGADRHELPPVNQHRALIIHVPSNALHHVALHWVDIENGWGAFQLALSVRDMRNLGRKFLLNQLVPAGAPLDQLPISDDDIAYLVSTIKALAPDDRAALKDAWPKTVPTPGDHLAGRAQILRSHAPEIKQLLTKKAS
jgi:hypothetical protein